MQLEASVHGELVDRHHGAHPVGLDEAEPLELEHLLVLRVLSDLTVVVGDNEAWLSRLRWFFVPVMVRACGS